MAIELDLSRADSVTVYHSVQLQSSACQDQGQDNHQDDQQYSDCGAGPVTVMLVVPI